MPVNKEHAETTATPNSTADKSSLRRIATNTAANAGSQAVVIGLAVITTPYIANHLGTDQYGSLLLLMSYVTVFSLLNLGVNTSLVKYLAHSLATNDGKDVNHFLSTSLTVLTGSSLILVIPALVCADAIVQHAFTIPAPLAHSVATALRISAVALLVQFLSQVISSVPAAAQRFDLLNFVNLTAEGARLGGSVAVLALGYSLPAVMSVTLATSLGALLVHGFVAIHLAPGLIIRPGFSREHARTLLHHSKYVFIGVVSNRLVSTADTLLIGYYLPVRQVAYYGVAYTIGQKLWTAVGNLATVLFPAASSLAAQGRNITDLYLRGSRWSAALMLTPTALVYVFRQQLLLFWMGPEYAENGSFLLACLVTGFALNGLTCVPYQLLQGTRYASTAALAAGIYSAINLALFVSLIPLFGTRGAAAAFLGAQLLFVPFFMHRATSLLGSDWSTVLRRAYLGPAVAAAALAVISASMRPYVASLMGLFFAFGVLLPIYAAIAYVLVLDGQERDACAALLQRVLWRVRRHAGARPKAWTIQTL